MDDPRWLAVEDVLAAALLPPDEAFRAALDDGEAAADAAGLPPIQVSPLYGRFLELLVRLRGARSVLEVGTLAGYSTTWMARGVGPGGRVVTLEIDQRHADLARANLAAAGFADVVEVVVGPALETLPQLAASDAGPFDVVFIDADKESGPDYVRWALELSRPGSLIVVDNVVRSGRIVEPAAGDRASQGVRRMLELVAAEPRLLATALQTVGAKGWDGLLVALVVEPPS